MRDTNFGTNCVCRVPKKKLEEVRVVQCIILQCVHACVRACACVDGHGTCEHVQRKAKPDAHRHTNGSVQ